MEEIATPRLIAQNNGKALALVIPAELVKKLSLVKGQKMRVVLNDQKEIVVRPLGATNEE